MSMIKLDFLEQGKLNPFTSAWLNDLNLKILTNLEKAAQDAKQDLLIFIKERDIKTSNPEKLSELLINIWIRSKQAIDILKNTDYEHDRAMIENGIIEAKESIKRFGLIQQSCTIMNIRHSPGRG